MTNLSSGCLNVIQLSTGPSRRTATTEHRSFEEVIVASPERHGTSGEGWKQKMRRGAQDERCPNLEDVEDGWGKVRWVKFPPELFHRLSKAYTTIFSVQKKRPAVLPPFYSSWFEVWGQRCFFTLGEAFCNSPRVHDIFGSENCIPPRRFETSCVALFYSGSGDRGAFSPWGKLFCDSPRVHPWWHSLLFALLQTQHLIWICVLAISYW